MDWSSDDALTPAPKTYARDFYYDSDDDSPAAKATPPARPSAAARRAARDGRAAARPPETPIDRSSSAMSPVSRSRARLAGSSETSNPGASLCEEGDKLRLGFDVPRSVTGAFELYKRAATEHDYPPAFFRLGNCFSAEGLGAPDGPDETTALSWFSRGAETHGDTQCLVALGEAHERKGDLPRAAGFFKAAAQSARNAKTPGAREAFAHVARFAENGRCVSVIPAISEDESRRTHERLAKEGSVLSQRELGMREARDAESDKQSAERRDARLARARALLASAAAAGDAEAINQLGILHEDGLIVCDASEKTKDKSDRGEHDDDGIRSFVVAKRLYARAARLGHERATNNLGFLCASAGEHAEAAAHFRAAALVHGDADAAHNLGHFYETGVGVEKDLREAARLYAEAAAKGHESARDAATRLAADATREDDEPPGSSGAASLRRRLAAKENETARLAKDLGEAKAETTRLKGKIAELKVRNADLEKTKARKAEGSMPSAIPSGFDATAKEKAGFGIGRDPGSAIERPREFTRSTSLMSDRTTHSNYSAYSGLSGVSARDANEAAAEEAAGPGSRARLAGRDPERLGAKGSGSSTAGGSSSAARSPDRGDAARLAAQKRASRKSVKSLRSGASGFAGVFGMLSGATRGGSGGGSLLAGGGDAAADRELMKAHAREMSALKHEMEEVRFKAETHEEMSSTLSALLKATYARNLQLEELLESVGLDPNDEAVAKGLHPIKLERVAGVAVGDAGVFRDGAKRKKEEHALSLAPATR